MLRKNRETIMIMIIIAVGAECTHSKYYSCNIYTIISSSDGNNNKMIVIVIAAKKQRHTSLVWLLHYTGADTHTEALRVNKLPNHAATVVITGIYTERTTLIIELLL